MPPVRVALQALSDEAGPFGVLDRALVEPVALELDAVIVEVEQKMADEQAGGRVCDSSSAKVGQEHEAAEVCDTAPAAEDLESHDARALSFDLYDEAAVVLRFRLRAFDLGEEGFAVTRRDRSHEGLNGLVP